MRNAENRSSYIYEIAEHDSSYIYEVAEIELRIYTNYGEKNTCTSYIYEVAEIELRTYTKCECTPLQRNVTHACSAQETTLISKSNVRKKDEHS